MTKLSERMLRDLHVGIGDIVLSDIINEASALEESRDWWKDKAGQHKARANNLEHDFDVMRHAKQSRIEALERKHRGFRAEIETYRVVLAAIRDGVPDAQESARNGLHFGEEAALRGEEKP